MYRPISESAVDRSSLVDVDASRLPDADVDGRATSVFDGIGSYQHAVKILSSEVLASPTPSSLGSKLGIAHLPVAYDTSDVREPHTRPGLLAFTRWSRWHNW